MLSVGDVTKRSMLVRYGLPEDVGIKELRAAGAVCDIIGQFIDDRGRPIDHSLNRRAIALPLHDLSGVSTVVFAAGGSYKARAIAAVLRGGFGSVFVCDEYDCAGRSGAGGDSVTREANSRSRIAQPTSRRVMLSAAA